MLRSKFLYVTLFLVSGIALFTGSCTGNETSIKLVSEANSSKSHHFGKDCMSCHSEKGEAKAIFSVAASVLDEGRLNASRTAIIELYTRPKAGGKMLARLIGDGRGNFYTTEKIDFKDGLYPMLIGTPGVKDSIKFMGRASFNGSCNSCHGVSEERLGID